MKVLVTGGAGYIGSHTVNQLLQEGHEVVVYDNLSTGFREAVPSKARFIMGDIRDPLMIDRVVKDFAPQAVIHFAAKLNVFESTQKPLEYFETNAMGCLNLLKAIEKHKIPNLVFSSTAALYGNVDETLPLKEHLTLAPTNPYGQSKLMAEKMIQEAAQVNPDFHFVCLRYFNVAGAGDDLNNGQRTADAFHLVHLASQTAIGKRASLKVFGTDYPTADGTCIRDYIHVEDLAEIHLKAMKYLSEGGASDIFNCGYGQGYSVKEVIQSMLKESGVDFKVEEAGRRAGDVPFLVADSSKAQKKLGWKPQRNDIQKICRSAFQWEQKYSQAQGKK